DELIRSLVGSYESEIERGEIAWSNELALHVLELKTNGPASSLHGLAEAFQSNVREANRLLAPLGARLLPSGMHPWMNPERDFRLWPHEHNIVYETFDRIFGCAGHGWANVQSTHINLPFADDLEFGKLHAAIRLVLPLIPGLAASTPIVDGRATGFLDTRLNYYATNSKRVPSVTGAVVPEPIFSITEYRDGLLQQIYTDLEPFDPDGVLRHEWANARGSIARFDRMALEVRIVDVQECPAADLAVAAVISEAVRWQVEEAWCGSKEQRAWDHRELAAILHAGIRDGDRALIDDRRFLKCFGFPEKGRARFGDVWQHLVEGTRVREPMTEAARTALDVILEQGCLARRVIAASDQDSQRGVYRRLADCLSHGRSFEAIG
ncbi:MAG TPA: glutamate-cysteine ligase family protein, partial [Gammaproteobacteria bacterium]|nr:glutamate-cysteine ligase family protein [Gammaproteobacteria bacterium]